MAPMSRESQDDLLELIQRALQQEGSTAAYNEARDELVRRTQGLLFRYLVSKTRTFRRVPGDDDIKDIIQEAYFDAFRSLRTFKSELATFQSWLCSIALRQGFKWLKKADRHGGAYSLDEQPEEGEAPYPEPASPGHLLIEQKMILKDLLRHMAEAIEQLTNQDYRLVVGLLATGWYTMGEVQELLGWNINTLKSAFRRGFAEVKARISMKAGATYAMMAEGLIATHKKSTLAKGMSCMDVDTIGKIADPVTRELVRKRLLEGLSEEKAAAALRIKAEDARRRLYDGVTELVSLVRQDI
jgi:RNA polymerase sigma factor (sigma-70 family)